MVFNLLQDLAQYLDSALSRLYQETADTETPWRAPGVLIGRLDQVTVETAAFPLVVVEAVKGIDLWDRAEAIVVLTCGVYTAQADMASGVREVLNLLTRTRQAVLEAPAGILNRRYELARPVRWRMDLEDRDQDHPYYWGQIKTKWKQAVMVPKMPQGVIDAFGSGFNSD